MFFKENVIKDSSLCVLYINSTLKSYIITSSVFFAWITAEARRVMKFLRWWCCCDIYRGTFPGCLLTSCIRWAWFIHVQWGTWKSVDCYWKLFRVVRTPCGVCYLSGRNYDNWENENDLQKSPCLSKNRIYLHQESFWAPVYAWHHHKFTTSSYNTLFTGWIQTRMQSLLNTHSIVCPKELEPWLLRPGSSVLFFHGPLSMFVGHNEAE